MHSTDGVAIPYGIISDCFWNHTIIPFLGAAASYVGAPASIALPGGAKLARRFAEKGRYPGHPTDPLTKVAQFLEEESADRDFLLGEISTIFHDGVPQEYSSALTEFVGRLPEAAFPRLILTTNYDILLERTLERLGIPYLAISHIRGKSKFAGRLLCYRSLEAPLDKSAIFPLREVVAHLHEIAKSNDRTVLIYKMHGTSRLKAPYGMIDSVVLTENDYIDFLARDMLRDIPSTILSALRLGRLLFLGYSLEDWNFRVLLRRLHLVQRSQQEGQKRHWACVLSADQVEVRFWERRSVNLYQYSLDEFLSNLGEFITRGAP